MLANPFPPPPPPPKPKAARPGRDSADDDPRGLLRVADAAKPAAVSKKAPSKAKAKPKSSVGSGAGSSSDPVPKPGPSLPPQPKGPPVPPSPEAEFMLGAPKHPGPPPSKAEPRGARRGVQRFDAVGGGRVSYDEYHSTTTGNLYKNCQLFCDCVRGCSRTRGFGPTNTRNLGELEVLAFLHAWRDTPPQPGKSHRQTDPPKAMVTEYYNEHLIELQALHALLAQQTA